MAMHLNAFAANGPTTENNGFVVANGAKIATVLSGHASPLPNPLAYTDDYSWIDPPPVIKCCPCDTYVAAEPTDPSPAEWLRAMLDVLAFATEEARGSTDAAWVSCTGCNPAGAAPAWVSTGGQPLLGEGFKCTYELQQPYGGKCFLTMCVSCVTWTTSWAQSCNPVILGTRSCPQEGTTCSATPGCL